MLALNLDSKYIHLQGFFYYKFCHLVVEGPKSFRDFTPWTPTRTLQWTYCRAYSTFQNSIFVQKTDIRTAWINAWYKWRNLTLAQQFWAIKKCLQASKISEICISMSINSFCFRHTFPLSAHCSQSHATSCSSLMCHHRVNNKCNRVKGRRWKWLIYALRNFLLCNNIIC